MSAPGIVRHGSTVQSGGYECEVHDCYAWRRRGASGRVARWLAWRLSPTGHVIASWIICDECPHHESDFDRFDRNIVLPLLHPSDPYARIAVEEMLYALTALLRHVRVNRWPSAEVRR